MAITTSLVINFSDENNDENDDGESDVLLDAEINAIDNDDKTNFTAGDIVYFRIYHSSGYIVTQTAGSTVLSQSNRTTTIIDEEIQFAFSTTASTDKLITTLDSFYWIGNNLGTIIKSNDNEVACEVENDIGIAKITYQTKYDLWAFNSPASINGSVNYSVIIGITAI